MASQQRVIVRVGANVNQQVGEKFHIVGTGRTALIFASAGGHLEIVNALIAAGEVTWKVPCSHEKLCCNG